MSTEKYIHGAARTIVRTFPAYYAFAFETKVFLVKGAGWEWNPELIVTTT